jgi:hypothetical protein
MFFGVWTKASPDVVLPIIYWQWLRIRGPGPPSVVKRPCIVVLPAQSIGFEWRFCMGAQGVKQPKMAVSGPAVMLGAPTAGTFRDLDRVLAAATARLPGVGVGLGRIAAPETEAPIILLHMV